MAAISAKPQGFLALVPSRVKWLIVVLSANTLGVGYFSIVLTAFLPQVGVSTTIVGTIVGAEGITLVILSIPLGILSDRRGRKWILILASLGLPPVFLTLALTRFPFYLVLAGVVTGIAEGGFLATFNAIIADQTPAKEGRNNAFAFSFILSTVSSGVGYAIPLAFPFIGVHLGISALLLHRDVLLIFGISSFSLPVLLWL